MRLETGLALVATGLATLAPCTLGLSAGLGGLVATVGLIVAWRESRSALLPVLALVANLGALAALVVLVVLVGLFALSLALIVAAIAAVHSVPELSRWSPFGTGVLGELGTGGFWSTYRPELLVDHDGQENFFGGHCYLHWRAPSGERFDADELQGFAVEHGWRLHTREQVRRSELNAWAPACLLSLEQCWEPKNHEPGQLSPSYLGLPAVDDGERDPLYTVLAFDTGMYDGADMKSTLRSLVGFVTMTADGSELFVAHNWGE